MRQKISKLAKELNVAVSSAVEFLARARLRNAEARIDAKRAEAAIARAEARLKARLSGESNLKM